MEFALAHPYLTAIIVSVICSTFLGAVSHRGKDVHHYYYVDTTNNPEKEEKK